MISFLHAPYSDEETYALLHPLVKKWFCSSFSHPSPPQRFSIKHMLLRKNILISSPTGTGKTLSAFLAVLNELITRAVTNQLEERVYCVYVSPLKALGNDIEKNLLHPLEELSALHGSDLGIRVATRTGDTSAYEKQQMSAKPPHILITTPESLSLMLSSQKFSAHLSRIEYVIIDEIHALAENKRGTQLSLSLERLARLSSFCRVGLSATVAPLSEIASFLCGRNRVCDIADVQYVKERDIQVLCPVDNMLAHDMEYISNKQYELIHELVSTHKTTVIFTNTRSATERVVVELQKRYGYHEQLESITDYSDEQGDVRTTISAHHGSLSKERRLRVEELLRSGALRCVVSSTSLELGIDIGSIDLVILLGSPKSVSRALQRVGRSGHSLGVASKGRIIVLDRDDLVECAVLAREAARGFIDKVHIPLGCLDILAQEIVGLTLFETLTAREAFVCFSQAYPYKDLTFSTFLSVLRYLAGSFSSLEDRNVYPKIFFDEDTGLIRRRGRMARPIYFMNSGTIPDQTSVTVKVGEAAVGSISEPFLEGLKKGDVFVLGGETFEFRYSRGMTAQVVAVYGKQPTVPSWFSEMLPLSFDLALRIQSFRKDMSEMFSQKYSSQEIYHFLEEHFPLSPAGIKSVFSYFQQQHLFCGIPHKNRIIVEHLNERSYKYVIFHTLFGRRVNDVLSRAVAYLAGRLGERDVEVGISDNGFYLRYKGTLQAVQAFKSLRPQTLRALLRTAIDNSEVLARRFRHCAGRSFLILRKYKGFEKSVGRQQVSSKILLSSAKELGDDFCVLREARREVLEDVMDVESACTVLGFELSVQEVSRGLASPFAFSLLLQGYADILRVQEKHAFLQKMHQEVLAKLSLEQSRAAVEEFSYAQEFAKQEQVAEEKRVEEVLVLKEQLYQAFSQGLIPREQVYDIQKLIEGERTVHPRCISWLQETCSSTPSVLGEKLSSFLLALLPDLRWR